MTQQNVTARSESSTARSVEYAQKYLDAGLAVVPLSPDDKRPVIDNWPQLAADRAFTAADFEGQNVGVVLGTVSGDLVDIDLDSPAAIKLAPFLLRPTLTFGRKSKPVSHYLYISKGVRSCKHRFSVDGEQELIEVRSTNAATDACGSQTAFPGSVHSGGELVEFTDESVEPVETPAGELLWAVCRLTVASIILQRYSEGHGRNAQTLGLAGGLLKAGWTPEEVIELFDAVRACSGDDRAKDADAVVRTIEAFENGQDVTGFGSLLEDGVLPEHAIAEIQKHCRTPEARRKEATLARTRSGADLRNRAVAEARATDGMLAEQAIGVAPPTAPTVPSNDSEAAAGVVTEHADAWAALGTPIDLTVEPEPLAYLVDGLPFAPGGKVNALAGPPKGGKSPWALLLAICVATGTDFLGRRILRQGPALYLDAETGRLAHIRFRRMCRALNVDPAAVPLEFRDVATTFTATYVETLEALLRAQPKALVVIDTYGAMLDGEVDHNSADFAHWLKQLGRLTRTLDVVIVVLIHEKKSDKGMRKGSGLEMISGSFAAGGAMQSVVSLRPEGDSNDSPIAVSCSRAAEQDFRPFKIRWLDVPNPKGGQSAVSTGLGARWGLQAVLVDGETPSADAKAAADRKRMKIAQTIVEALTERPGLTERQTIKQAVGGREDVKEEVFAELLKDGVLMISTRTVARGRSVANYSVAARESAPKGFEKWGLR